jgi:hypothetical protein
MKKLSSWLHSCSCCCLSVQGVWFPCLLCRKRRLKNSKLIFHAVLCDWIMISDPEAVSLNLFSIDMTLCSQMEAFSLIFFILNKIYLFHAQNYLYRKKCQCVMCAFIMCLALLLCTPLMRLPPPQFQNHCPMGIMYIGAWEESNEKDICHLMNSGWWRYGMRNYCRQVVIVYKLWVFFCVYSPLKKCMWTTWTLWNLQVLS